jgi:polyisoprenoid-binding protein YceI
MAIGQRKPRTIIQVVGILLLKNIGEGSVLKREVNRVKRRDILKIGFGVLALSILAACAPGATTAPSATTAPVAAAPATQAPQAAATTAPTTQAADAPTATTAAAATTSNSSASGAQGAVYQIDPSKSKATFTLGEVLMGKNNTVVGATSKINGVISATLDHPADAKIGTIQIDATDFTTDSAMRNRMIQRAILQSQQPEFQYITFEPTGITGLPSAAVSAGSALPLKITGNLKIRNVVQPVTFDATVTVKSDTELDGTATVTVTRNAFQITIPNIPSVAGVTDQVALELQFVAMKQ